jgi:hypothetical protein
MKHVDFTKEKIMDATDINCTSTTTKRLAHMHADQVLDVVSCLDASVAQRGLSAA